MSADEKQPLTGTYRVSFDVKLNVDDAFALDDIVQAIASGFEGQPVLEKIANLKVEKSAVAIKVGQRVAILHPLEVTANVGFIDGFAVIANSFTDVEHIDSMTFTLPTCTATVNDITASGVELIDFDTSFIDAEGSETTIFSLTVPEEHLEVKE